jgi:DMSO/TMAO reductase YedYZ molybdopterin-dependent catalytic subunit
MMSNKKKIQWIVPVIVLVSIAFLISYSREIPGDSSAEACQPDGETSATVLSGPQLSDYRLNVDGLVDHPLSLTYDSILHYPTVTESILLVCPGVFKTQNEWTGVSLALILKDAGIKPEAKRIKFIASSDGYSLELSATTAQKEGVFLA